MYQSRDAMKIWSAYRYSNTNLKLVFFTMMGLFMLVISLLTHKTPILLIAAVLFMTGLLPQLYLKYVVRHFYFINQREKMYLSEGDEGDLHHTFYNNGVLPIVHVEVTVTIGQTVKINNLQHQFGDHYTYYFLLKKGEKRSYDLKIQGKQRGIAKMRNMTVTIMDPLRLMKKTLTYEFVHKEVVVFPKMKLTKGLKQLNLPKEGMLPRQNALFQDMTAPIGTREYMQTDPLKHVHWKASARTGKLQTKVFEKTIGMVWSVVILIDREVKKTTKDVLEEQLSAVATICREALKKGVNTEIYVNTRRMGQTSVMHLPPSNGRTHFMKSMEFLALIHTQQLKTPALTALNEIDRHFNSQRVIMVVDHLTHPMKNHYYQKWMKAGHKVINIDEIGTLVPVKIGGGQLAK